VKPNILLGTETQLKTAASPRRLCSGQPGRVGTPCPRVLLPTCYDRISL